MARRVAKGFDHLKAAEEFFAAADELPFALEGVEAGLRAGESLF